MEMHIFGVGLSRGTFVNEKTGESFPYNNIKCNVLATLTSPRENYVGQEVGLMLGDGSLWEKKVLKLRDAGKIPGIVRVTLGQRLRGGKLETLIMDLDSTTTGQPAKS